MLKKNSCLLGMLIKSRISLGFVLTIIIFALGTNLTTAKDKDLKQKGKNIILDSPSDSSLPIQYDEIEEINELLNQEGITKEEIKALYDRLDVLGEEYKTWTDAQLKDKEKLEKHKIKEDLIIATHVNEQTDSSVEVQLSDIPFTSIVHDIIHNSIEFTIMPEMFTEKNIEKYIRKIRKVVGDEVDITLSPLGYGVLKACGSRQSICNDVEAGVLIWTPNVEFGCTVGFPATLGEDKGFITAGHCVDASVGFSVEQPANFVFPNIETSVGIVIEENYNATGPTFCDCAFVKMIDSRKMTDEIFDYNPTPTKVGSNRRGNRVTMSGGTSKILAGSIDRFVLVRMVEHPITGVVTDMYNTWRVSVPKKVKFGNSGAPVVSDDEMRGIMSFAGKINGKEKYYFYAADRIPAYFGSLLTLGL